MSRRVSADRFGLHTDYCTLPSALQMPARRSSRKRRSKKVRPDRAKKSREPKGKQKRTPPRKKAAKKKRSSKKRSSNKRSSAAKKGWAKRRKKTALLEAMADLRARQGMDAQPLAWLDRRGEVRAKAGWKLVSMKSVLDARRLAALAELKIDFLPKHELYDYLEWIARVQNIEISDMYRLYLGYGVGLDNDNDQLH